MAIRERGGYALMPEWGTQPANHYLPRRKTEMQLHAEQLVRADNPLHEDGKLPGPAFPHGADRRSSRTQEQHASSLLGHLAHDADRRGAGPVPRAVAAELARAARLVPMPEHARLLVGGGALALLLRVPGSSLRSSHLGHPERAWRAAGMWRTSWLSREVIALPAFMAGVTAVDVAHCVGLDAIGTLGRLHGRRVRRAASSAPA